MAYNNKLVNLKQLKLIRVTKHCAKQITATLQALRLVHTYDVSTSEGISTRMFTGAVFFLYLRFHLG